MRKIIFYIIPIILLAYIFNKIDIAALKEILGKTDKYYLLAGFTAVSFSIVIGSFRWIVLSGEFKKKHKLFFIKHYWIGRAIGIFAPSTIGWDAYRILSAGKRFDNYLYHLLVIILEKIATLVSIFILIISLYHLVKIVNHKELLDDFYFYVFSGFISIIVFSVFIIKIKNIYIINIIFNKIYKIATEWSQRYRIIKKIHYEDIKKNYSIIFTEKNIAIALFFSFLIQANTALASYLFFAALNYEINYLVNLFAVSIMILIFIMPVSFGGIGIREISYIGIYYLFGVPAEISFAVSLLAFSAMLLNSSIGGLVILFNPNIKI